jgi:hypothetical protein
MYDEFGNWIPDLGVADNVPVAVDVSGPVTSATDTAGISQEVLPNGNSVTYYPDGAYTVVNDNGTYATDAQGNTIQYDTAGNLVANTAAGQTVNAPQITNTDLTGVVATISSLAQSALQLKQIWNSVGSPAPRVASPIRQASGAVSTPNKDGTITTRLPNGSTTVAAMPVGHAYVFPDGSSVINNGNGTFDTITQDGATRTAPLYVPTSAGSSTGLMVLGIGAVALLALHH